VVLSAAASPDADSAAVVLSAAALSCTVADCTAPAPGVDDCEAQAVVRRTSIIAVLNKCFFFMVFSSVNLLKNSLAETHQRNRVSGPYVKIYTTGLFSDENLWRI
jgi:hypothetical protein